MEDTSPAPATAKSSSHPHENVGSTTKPSATGNGEKTDILANLELANRVFASNLKQQNAVAYQQAVNHLRLAVAAKCAGLVLETKSAAELPAVLEQVRAVLEQLKDISASATPAFV